ncbi:hypothetical protein M885DRAFT_626276 [Pelagophyceae sp. CCMP2097]|nr:hypothetical protein M885DRAFT_626276 [Pelagophyceae sp. CCMP2097]
MRSLFVAVLWASVWASRLGAAAGDAVEDALAPLSVKELRLQARRLGLQDEVRHLLDKSEIRALVGGVLRCDAAKVRSDSVWKWLRCLSAFLVAVGVFAVAFEPVAHYVQTCGVGDWFLRQRYLLRQCRAADSNVAVCGVVLCAGLEAATNWLRVGIALSWVAPRAWRPWLIPPLPSLALDPGRLTGAGPSGYGIDVAPMALMWAAGFLRRQIEHRVALRMQARFAATFRSPLS